MWESLFAWLKERTASPLYGTYIISIECRVYDEKRKGLKVGDTIEFSNRQDESKKITAEVIALHVFPSFSELLSHFPASSFDTEGKQEFPKVSKKFYSHKEEKKYGVVGIEIKLR